MSKSFEEIDRAKAVQAIEERVEGAFPSRAEVIAEQDKRNEEARAATAERHEAVFGGVDTAIVGTTEAGPLVNEEAIGSAKPAAKKSTRK